jgi:hypothetical protein
MTIPVWLALLIYALAVARVTGLVVADSITEPLRDRLSERVGHESRWAVLVTCPWCAGMWVALVAAPLVWLVGDSPVMLVMGLALAFSQVTGMTNQLGR